MAAKMKVEGRLSTQAHSGVNREGSPLQIFVFNLFANLQMGNAKGIVPGFEPAVTTNSQLPCVKRPAQHIESGLGCPFSFSSDDMGGFQQERDTWSWGGELR